MNTDAWLQLVQQGGMTALIASFLTGLVFSFNPVAMAAVPVALAYVTKARETRQAVLYGAMFVAGMLVTHTALGFLAGLGGSWVQGLLGRFWGLLLGPILILLGLVWTGWVRIPCPPLRCARAGHKASGVRSAWARRFRLPSVLFVRRRWWYFWAWQLPSALPSRVPCCCWHSRWDAPSLSCWVAWPWDGWKACVFWRTTGVLSKSSVA